MVSRACLYVVQCSMQFGGSIVECLVDPRMELTATTLSQVGEASRLGLDCCGTRPDITSRPVACLPKTSFHCLDL